ncbi:MAG: beta-ketoacyl-ACP synthase II [Syntrophobacteraceae bacterium]|jgi:3-oxoacyl-[acyl-carrier-protein] synthase II|nr:beta-ketoacyl-ACP synthase II [Syntrophobacteraceae bacterium]
MNTVVVTGAGVVSSIGCTKDTFWTSLVEGVSGVKPISAFDASLHKTRIAAEVTSLAPEQWLGHKQIRRMARVSLFASCAAVEAVRDAGLDLEKEDRSRVGCVVGSAAGDYGNLEEQFLRFRSKGPGSVSPLTVPKVIPNMPAANVAIVLGIQGPSLGVATACATGCHAVGLAMGILGQGHADVMLAGGAESTITPFVLDGYASMGVLSERNERFQEASRPFDADRDGFVLGEGAGVLVLETLEHARKRGAEILACAAGFGMTSDAYNIAIPEPDGRAAARAMEQAMRQAGLNREDVGHINAHGTSTQVNDRVETNAIRLAFGDRHRRVLVSSNKSMIGHTLGAAGAIEAVAAVLTLYHGVIPPTINYRTRDPQCDLSIVGEEAREARLKAALSNSFGFGGQNAVAAFTRRP